ncbi:MAG: hypothetical protein M0Z33_02155, partial [Actinomycetota bacterium]|nr:hypothetical protein [Actinomycetota bacterium]
GRQAAYALGIVVGAIYGTAAWNVWKESRDAAVAREVRRDSQAWETSRHLDRLRLATVVLAERSGLSTDELTEAVAAEHTAEVDRAMRRATL